MLHMTWRRSWYFCSLFVLSIPVLAGTAGSSADVSSEDLRSILEKTRTDHDVPAISAGLISRGNECIEVVGVRKRGTETAATRSDLWHIGSDTKPITAFLTAILIDRGLLSWDTRLDKIFPECAEKWSPELQSIAPVHLLTHTSGLPSTGPLLAFLLNGSKHSPREDRENIISHLHDTEMIGKPGEKYHYSNLGYILLGAIIDRRGKASWEEQLDKNIFRPLGITRYGCGPISKIDNLLQPWPHKENGKPVKVGDVMDNPAVMNSAGRIHITISDYHRFLAETLKLARREKGLLTSGTSAKLFTNPFPVSPHSLSGWCGFRKKTSDKGLVLAHDGSNTFNYTTTFLAPDRDFALCVMANQGGASKACEQVKMEILEMVKK